MFQISSVKLKILVAAIVSPLVAIFQLLNSSCIIRNLKPAVQRHGFYTFYLELPNGTRLRQMADVVYDERQVQVYFFHGFLIAIVLPGFFMPFLLHLAERRQKQDLFIWWICWITLHNVHAFMQIFTYAMNLAIILYWEGLGELLHFDYWMFFSLCNVGSTLNSLGAPLTIYLSIFLVRHYQNLKDISPKGSRNSSNSSNNRFQPLLPSNLESGDLIHRSSSNGPPTNLLALISSSLESPQKGQEYMKGHRLARQ